MIQISKLFILMTHTTCMLSTFQFKVILATKLSTPYLRHVWAYTVFWLWRSQAKLFVSMRPTTFMLKTVLCKPKSGVNE